MLSSSSSSSFSLLLLLCLWYCGSGPVSAASATDQHSQCSDWADMGECDKNPGYMLVNCIESCDRVKKRAADDNAAAMNHDDEQLNTIKSFFDLSAVDIDGNIIQFEEFRHKVTIVTNVASYCGYTDSHYKSLVQLYNKVKNLDDGTTPIEILAFPCNQFGQQEPGSATEIKAFAQERGVTFRMMYKINVNGPNTDIVYRYLKKMAGPHTIRWNFATYYVISPNTGTITAYDNVLPTDLEQTAINLLKNEEL